MTCTLRKIPCHLPPLISPIVLTIFIISFSPSILRRLSKFPFGFHLLYTHPFHLSLPTYQQITKIVRRMKASSSPCPLDKISIIPFKRCPYLRSYIAELFRIIWQSGEVPVEWKKACIVLSHKKGPTDPANFWPITLERVPLKIFTSCIRESLITFVKSLLVLQNFSTARKSGNIS